MSIALSVMIGYGEINGLTNGPLYAASPFAFWVVEMTFQAAIPLTIAWFLRARFLVSPSQYGLRFPPPVSVDLLGSTFFFTILLAAVPIIPSYIVWAVTGFPKPIFLYGDVVPNNWLYLPTVIYLAASAALIESAAFIGLPWLICRERYGKRINKTFFLIISSAVFASVHWEQNASGMVGAFIFGLLACHLYLKTGDLWSVVGAHFVVDVIAFA